MNQYRCETCKNRKGVYDIPFCDCWDKKIPITKYGMDLISHIGCASHSDFQSERDTVLERLHIWFENYCEGNEDPDLWMAFLHVERTLRQKCKEVGNIW